MGVDALLKEVEDKRKKALADLEADYAAKRDEVRKRTEEQLAYMEGSAKRDASVLAQKETTRVQGASKLQSKKLVFDATEKLLEHNIAALRGALEEYAASAAYPELLGRMAKYATRRLGGKIVVHCRKGDDAPLKSAGAKIGSTGLNSIGGFRAESEDGTLELDLTFEEILRSREDEVRAAILGKE